MADAPSSYADFKRFWALVHQVRRQIQFGFTADQAKADARELFQIAKRELQRMETKQETCAKN